MPVLLIREALTASIRRLWPVVPLIISSVTAGCQPTMPTCELIETANGEESPFVLIFLKAWPESSGALDPL